MLETGDGGYDVPVDLECISPLPLLTLLTLGFIIAHLCTQA